MTRGACTTKVMAMGVTGAQLNDGLKALAVALAMGTHTEALLHSHAAHEHTGI